MSRYETVEVFQCDRGHVTTKPAGTHKRVPAFACGICGKRKQNPATFKSLRRVRASANVAAGRVSHPPGMIDG